MPAVKEVPVVMMPEREPSMANATAVENMSASKSAAVETAARANKAAPL
jgi:hypothetical protein